MNFGRFVTRVARPIVRLHMSIHAWSAGDERCARLKVLEPIGARVRFALLAWCETGALSNAEFGAPTVPTVGSSTSADALVVRMYHEEATSLVRLARLFVDDRNAAEDLVQEAFIRLARNAHRIGDVDKAPAYLRSIVLNLARDLNRRGLVSLRHRSSLVTVGVDIDDQLVTRDDQRRVLEALRDLPARQRSCIVLRYYDELGIDDIASMLGVSRNSVKTHLQRGLAALAQRLQEPA
jgi:RNA polymerase sigma factor (sigma-70 family)